jgi:hypothetical protein
MADTSHMTYEEYMAFLYDRGARRLGYQSYAEQRADIDATLKLRLEDRDASGRADMEAWAKAQLHGGN